MTSRERWTVYPLLFFSLALGFKSNYRNPVEFRCHSIECHSLSVSDNIRVARINGDRADRIATGSLTIIPNSISRDATDDLATPPTSATAPAAERDNAAGADPEARTEATPEQESDSPEPTSDASSDSDSAPGSLDTDSGTGADSGTDTVSESEHATDAETDNSASSNED